MFSPRQKLRALKARRKELTFPYRPYHRKHNCIFIHIPKVAGTSILDALGKKRGGRLHLSWYVYYTANPVYFASAFKFAFVRNPWCRALSAYNYLKNGGNQKADLQLAKKISAFEDFDAFVVEGLGKGYFRSNFLFVPQSEFVVDGEGNIVVDFLGRFERLKEDFRYVAQKLSLDPDLPEKNRNADAKGYRGAYRSQAAIDMVEEIYRQDILMFDYSF